LIFKNHVAESTPTQGWLSSLSRHTVRWWEGLDASTIGDHTMFPFWLIMGSVIILFGIFNRQLLQLLGLKPMSEVFTTPNLKHSSKSSEKIGQWIVITLGANFLVQGLGKALPNDISYKISLLLLGLSGLMLLAILGITVANWKAR
jgi:hypothetical protein